MAETTWTAALKIVMVVIIVGGEGCTNVGTGIVTVVIVWGVGAVALFILGTWRHGALV